MNNVQTTPSILTEIGDQLIRGVDYRIETRNYDCRWRNTLNTVEQKYIEQQGNYFIFILIYRRN